MEWKETFAGTDFRLKKPIIQPIFPFDYILYRTRVRGYNQVSYFKEVGYF